MAVESLGSGVWLLRYPLKILGENHGRNATVLRLSNGQLVLHSTAPFTEADVEEIRKLGNPRWLVEASLIHDTFAKTGRAHFPESIYLAPRGFERVAKIPAQVFPPVPPEWEPDLAVQEVAGMPMLREYAFLHRSSKTLIVGDLVFNYEPPETGYEQFFRRWLMGLRQYPGVTRPFGWFIRDRKAFGQAIDTILGWDFDRLIPAHGVPILTGARSRLKEALKSHQLDR